MCVRASCARPRTAPRSLLRSLVSPSGSAQSGRTARAAGLFFGWRESEKERRRCQSRTFAPASNINKQPATPLPPFTSNRARHHAGGEKAERQPAAVGRQRVEALGADDALKLRCVVEGRVLFLLFFCGGGGGLTKLRPPKAPTTSHPNNSPCRDKCQQTGLGTVRRANQPTLSAKRAKTRAA